MQKIILDGSWAFAKAGDKTRLPITSPSSVYAGLLAAGKMEDPFWRSNEAAALALMDDDWEFFTTCTLSKENLDSDELSLVCEGLDTLCDVYMNGRLLGKADNMHRTWEFDLRKAARPGVNELRFLFHSPVQFIKNAQRKSFCDGSQDAMAGFPHIRKAHCMFGWDWGPRLPDMGLWRPAYIRAASTARIDNVLVRQKHNAKTGEVQLDVEMDAVPLAEISVDELAVRLSVIAPDGEEFNAESRRIVIKKPKLWWPHGYGAQPLYTVKVTLYTERNGEVIDSWERRIGLRTLTVRRAKDKWGESFAHEVNGLPVFAMGADYIPEDNILSRVTPERTRRLLEDAALANHNTIRVWGGGYFPDDFFYDICDELGLLVWQDFPYACAMYDLTKEFQENITQEAIENVLRLRHHASLAVLCGNNEIESQVSWWKGSPKQKSDYVRIFEHILPAVVEQYAPETFYWPSSPSSGGAFDNPNDPNRGDTHYWDVWHGGKPFTDYRNYFFRYASEFGFQSFPSLKTIAAFTLPEDRNIFSYVMEKHQRNGAANGKILNYLSETFLYPAKFENLIYASQLLQAEAIRYGVEHWRRNRGRCMGAIYWQLNDCWPAASWSSIDYFGRWKALHYYAKRFFAPLMISACEEGTLTGGQNVNVEGFSSERTPKTARLAVANETLVPFSGTAHWALRNPAGEVIKSGRIPVQAGPLSSIWLDQLDFSGAPLYQTYLSFELQDKAGSTISAGTVLFCAPKHFAFADPYLEVKLDKDKDTGARTITVKAAAYARSVEIDSPDKDILLEDNYFDLNGGSRTVKILRGTPGKLLVRSVYDIR